MRKFDTLIFDLDGTIADTDEMIVRTMNTLYDLYRDGKRTPVEEIYYFSGPPIYDTLRKEFPHQDLSFMLEEFRRVSIENYPHTVKTYPHAKETLIALKEKGYKLGIVTNKIHSSTVFCLSVIGLEGIFDSLICFDDVSKPKPSGEPIIKCAAELGAFDFSKVLYIGDNKSDLITANNAGVSCALVNWGPRVLDKDLKPDYIIASFKELERIL